MPKFTIQVQAQFVVEAEDFEGACDEAVSQAMEMESTEWGTTQLGEAVNPIPGVVRAVCTTCDKTFTAQNWSDSCPRCDSPATLVDFYEYYGPTPPEGGRCMYCGCTDDHACPGGCAWVDQSYTVCSSEFCVEQLEKLTAVAA